MWRKTYAHREVTARHDSLPSKYFINRPETEGLGEDLPTVHNFSNRKLRLASPILYLGRQDSLGVLLSQERSDCIDAMDEEDTA